MSYVLNLILREQKVFPEEQLTVGISINIDEARAILVWVASPGEALSFVNFGGTSIVFRVEGCTVACPFPYTNHLILAQIFHFSSPYPSTRGAVAEFGSFLKELFTSESHLTSHREM